MTDLRPDRSNPTAPFGYEADGTTPNAPYGLKVDGSPRMDRRGATAGQFGTRNTAPAAGRGRGPGRRKPRATAGMKSTASSLSDVQRKSLLVDLVNNLVVTPLASLSRAPFLEKYIGPAQTDALAGDAFILAQFAPHLAEAAIVMDKVKPKTLAWLEKAEENAPYLLLAQVGLQMVKAIADNHMRPNPNVAAAGRELSRMRIAEMAEEINRQAAAMNPDPTVEMPVAA
jgi:hypothetical protein